MASQAVNFGGSQEMPVGEIVTGALARISPSAATLRPVSWISYASNLQSASISSLEFSGSLSISRVLNFKDEQSQRLVAAVGRESKPSEYRSAMRPSPLRILNDRLHTSERIVRKERESAERAWIKANFRDYDKQWVALVGGTLVAANVSLRSVSEAISSRTDHPLLVKIYADTPLMIGG